jgi:DNA-binding NarL/FixJ family response regulator
MALDHGASAVIPKSSSVQTMVSALRLVLAGGIYAPHALPQSGINERTYAARCHAAASFSPDMRNNVFLTQRQRDVLNCMREGKSQKQIAYELGLSERTVKIQINAICKAFGIKNQAAANSLAYAQAIPDTRA